MALNTIELTETQLFQKINATGLSFSQTFEAIKLYIDEKNTVTNTQLTTAFQAGDKAVKDALDIDVEALSALKVILDGWDGTEDGALNLGQIRIDMQTAINAMGGRVNITESNIVTLFTQLNQEKQDRISLGTTLAEAIASVSNDGAKLISGVQTALGLLTTRVSIIEDTLNYLIGLVVNGANKTAEVMQSTANTAKTIFAVPINTKSWY